MDDLRRGWVVIDRHRNLFDLDGDVTRSAMHLGLQVEDGWLGLIDRMCDQLEAVAPGGFKVLSVKSKYATLRVAYRGGDDAVEVEVERTKTEALRTCSRCGAVGQQSTVDGELVVWCSGCRGVRGPDR